MIAGIVLLVVHVVAAVLFVGTVAVASSIFAGFVPAAADAPSRRPRSLPVAASLHRISRVYGVLALIVPAAGVVLGVVFGKFGEAWLLVALTLTVVAGVLFAVRILPGQAAALREPPTRRALAQLASLTGVYNLLWVVVLVLMVVRPGEVRHG